MAQKPEELEDQQWVAAKMAATAPEWEPRPEVAWRRVVAAPRPPRTLTWAAAAALAAMLVGIVALPQGRLVAQNLWARMVFGRVDVVQLDLSRLKLDTSVSLKEIETPIADLATAEARAGFRPLMTAVVGGAETKLTISGPLDVRQRIHTKSLEEALAAAGAHDLAVPAQWEGVELYAHVGKILIAHRADGVQIVETLPLSLTVPQGFPLAQFAETAMRGVGMNWWEAREFGRKFVENPAWLLQVDPGEPVRLSEIPLASGKGIVIEDPSETDRSERVSVFYSTRDRLFLVTGPTRETAIRAARQLP